MTLLPSCLSVFVLRGEICIKFFHPFLTKELNWSINLPCASWSSWHKYLLTKGVLIKTFMLIILYFTLRNSSLTQSRQSFSNIVLHSLTHHFNILCQIIQQHCFTYFDPSFQNSLPNHSATLFYIIWPIISTFFAKSYGNIILYCLTHHFSVFWPIIQQHCFYILWPIIQQHCFAFFDPVHDDQSLKPCTISLQP